MLVAVRGVGSLSTLCFSGSLVVLAGTVHVSSSFEPIHDVGDTGFSFSGIRVVVVIVGVAEIDLGCCGISILCAQLWLFVIVVLSII